MTDKASTKYSQLFISCIFCNINRIVLENHLTYSGYMAAVPQGAFAAKKVRKNEERIKEYNFNMELNPTNYNSKFMNSIWGQYNRYSVHNLKKIMGDNIFVMSPGKQNKDLAVAQPVEKNSFSTELRSPFSSKKMYN